MRQISGTTKGTTQIPALDDYATDCLLLQLAQRECLPKAGNGRPMAPSDPYAGRVLKDMADGKSQEYRRILAAALVNLKDGVSPQTVKLPLRRMEAIIDVEAGLYRPRSLVALSRRETREQHLVDLAQLRVVVDENDPEALEQLEGELASYLAIADEMMAETQRRLAYLRRGDAPVAPPAPTDGRPQIVRIK